MARELREPASPPTKSSSGTMGRLGRNGRVAILISAMGLLVWVGWEIIGNTVADTRASSDPQTALIWRANDADALIDQAETQLAADEADRDLASVMDLSRRALRADPIASDALRTLALATELSGDGNGADALMSLAANRSLRDTGAQAWLFDQRLRQRKFAEALQHADAILRTRPDLLDQFLAPLTAIAADGPGRQALVDVLKTDPPWRAWFLARLPQQSSASTTYAVLSALATAAAPLPAAELQPYIDQLIKGGDYQVAFLAWLHFLPPAQSNALPYLFNGDFELPVSGIVFDWTIATIRGATTTVVDTGEKDLGHVLRAVFSSTRVPYRQVSKLLVLPPGAYDLTGLVKSDNFVNARGMVWQITCAEDETQVVGTSDPVVGTSSWRSFGMGFVVPSSGCQAQWLRLKLAARIPVEEQVSGAIWYDRLAITRANSTPTSG